MRNKYAMIGVTVHTSLVLILSLSPAISFCQTMNIVGIVVSDKNTPLPGASVSVSVPGKSVITDSLGLFSVENVPLGECTLTVSHIGFRSVTSKLVLTTEKLNGLRIQLSEEIVVLDEVTIQGADENTLLVESPASVSILKTDVLYNRSINTADAINTISGVQVRQSGGVGSNAEVSVQGLSGRQVRLFIDNVPIDFLLPVEELGTGVALSMIPVNMIQQVEVYKGIVPVTLGADALGGAIHIVTRKSNQDYVDVSAEHSSFNTWRSAISVRKSIGKRYYVMGNASYLRSDNNYELRDVEFINAYGNPERIRANKFHDQFKTYLAQAEVGVTEKPWATLLSLRFSLANLYDEIQHNFEMRQPYGQALNLATTKSAALRYENHLYGEKLLLLFYLGYNQINTSFIDTTLNIYTWRGTIFGKKNYGGEISTVQSHLNLTGHSIVARAGVQYQPSPSAKVTFSTTASSFTRSGTDPVSAEYYGEDLYREPIYIKKLVTGIEWEQDFFNEKVTTQTAFKQYYYEADGFEIDFKEAISVSQVYSRYGVSQSVSWRTSSFFLTKASYEYATRLPDRTETLGDFSMGIRHNPGLRPENSHNINVGGYYKNQRSAISLNGFYRNVSDIIILQPAPLPILSQYQNLLKTIVRGVEAEAQTRLFTWLTLRGNITYQDLRNYSDKSDAGVSNNRYYGMRLPNRPYLFGSTETTVKRDNIIREKDKLEGWWSSSYVHSFFRYWQIDGKDREQLTVPIQWLNNMGLSYTTCTNTWSVSFEIQNLFDQRAYDFFRVQKPGRSYHIKLRFLI